MAVLLSAGSASAQDARDEDIFGAAAPSGTKALTSDTEMAKRLVDTLQIGGRLEVRTDTGTEEKTKATGSGFGQLKQADLYFDTRPNKDLRAFLRLRFTEASGTDAAQASSGVPCTSNCLRDDIDEMWFKWGMQDTVYATLGKQHVKWGSGRFWNPTDFTASRPIDPLALFDRRLGSDMLKLHLPFEKQGYNLYAILQYANANQIDQMSGALRGEFAFGGVGEVAVSLQGRAHAPIRAGLDVSSGLGPIDVHSETAVTKREDQLLYEGKVEPLTGQLPTPYRRSDRWYVQTVAGMEHTFKYNADNTVTLGAEYFYNQLGYDDRDLELYSLVTGQSRSLYGGSRYAGVYLRLPYPGSWTETSFFIDGLRNLADKTSQVRVTGSWLLYKDAEIQGYLSQCQGDYGELCFRVPESFKGLASLPQVPARLQTIAQNLPTKRTQITVGAGIVLKF